MVIVRLAGVIEQRPREEHPLAILAALVAIAVVEMALTAIAEELLFRGLLLNALLAAWGTTRRGIYPAALTTSVVWGAVHLLNAGPISQLLTNASSIASIGLILAALRLQTGSIWVGVALHWLNNVTGVLALLGSASGWWIKTPATVSSWTQLGVSALLALGGLALIESHCRSLQAQPRHTQQATADVPTT
jgi:membrane protease YdiL (CAAX protease family)